MKFSTNSSVLARALESVASVLPSKTLLPILNNVLFEQDARGRLSLTASDLDSTIVERLPVQFHTQTSAPPIRIAVPATYLLSTVRNLGDVPVTFEASHHYTLTIRSGTGEYTLSCHDGGDYPAVPVLETSTPQFSISREILSKAIEKAGFAISDIIKKGNPTTGILFQMHMDHLRIVGTDSLRLVLFRCLDVECSETRQAVLPISGLKGISRMSGDATCRVTIGEKHTAFDFGSARLVTRILDSKYPEYEKVIPKNSKRKFRVKREIFWAAARRTSFFAGTNAKQVRLDITADELRVSAEDIERAHKAYELIPCEYQDLTGEQEKLSLAYNSAYLLGALQHLESDHVVFEMNAPDGPGTVRPQINESGEDITMLLMPVMLSTYD